MISEIGLCIGKNSYPVNNGLTKNKKIFIGKPHRFQLVIIQLIVIEPVNNHELICFTGDRSFDKAKVVRAEFLGQKADFPAGPFHLVTRFKIPYSFVFNMKGRGRSYNFYATPAKVNEGSIESMVEEYAKVLEAMIRKYPEQWFNYYDFWTP